MWNDTFLLFVLSLDLCDECVQMNMGANGKRSMLVCIKQKTILEFGIPNLLFTGTCKLFLE